MSLFSRISCALSIVASLSVHGASAQSAADLATAAEGLVRTAMKNCELAFSDRDAYLAEVQQRPLNGFLRRAGKTENGEVTAANFLSGMTMPHGYFNERVVLSGQDGSIAGICTLDLNMSMDPDINNEALQKALTAINPDLKLLGGRMEASAREPLPEFDGMELLHQYSYFVDGWSEDPAISTMIQIQYNALEVHVFRTPN